MRKVKPIFAAVLACFRLSANLYPKANKDMNHILYSSAFGNILYMIVCTKLDIAQTVSVVSMKLANQTNNTRKLSSGSLNI